MKNVFVAWQEFYRSYGKSYVGDMAKAKSTFAMAKNVIDQLFASRQKFTNCQTIYNNDTIVERICHSTYNKNAMAKKHLFSNGPIQKECLNLP